MNTAILTLTVTAAAALSANRFVTAVGAVPAAAAACIGVTRTSAAAAGDLVPVDALGTTMVEVGAGGVAAGAGVECDNTGKAITLASGVQLGRALTAGAAGALIEVLLIPN
jgi:hypothetical protein